MSPLPNLFCWTKMGAEAGQPLEAILRRKELERLAGSGSFAWGIGNSVPALRQVVADDGGKLPIVFSPMRAKPKALDERPSRLIVWLGYWDHGLVQPLPEHMLLTSRHKGRHFALFCRTDRSLQAPCSLELTFDDLRNAGTGSKLGFSQVTALVKREEHPAASGGKAYRVAFVADLEGPVHAQLAVGAEVPAAVADEVGEASMDATPGQWAAFVTTLRTRAICGLPEAPQYGLFATPN